MSHLNLELEQLEERVAPIGLGLVGVVIGIIDLGHGKDCHDPCDDHDPHHDPHCGNNVKRG